VDGLEDRQGTWAHETLVFWSKGYLRHFFGFEDAGEGDFDLEGAFRHLVFALRAGINLAAGPVHFFRHRFVRLGCWLTIGQPLAAGKKTYQGKTSQGTDQVHHCCLLVEWSFLCRFSSAKVEQLVARSRAGLELRGPFALDLAQANRQAVVLQKVD